MIQADWTPEPTPIPSYIIHNYITYTTSLGIDVQQELNKQAKKGYQLVAMLVEPVIPHTEYRWVWLIP